MMVWFFGVVVVAASFLYSFYRYRKFLAYLNEEYHDTRQQFGFSENPFHSLYAFETVAFFIHLLRNKDQFDKKLWGCTS